MTAPSSAWQPASAQLTPSGDAYTNTATPGGNFGAKPLLDVQSATQNSYIQFDPLVVEEDKPLEERGRYLNHEAFSQAAEKVGKPAVEAHKSN